MLRGCINLQLCNVQTSSVRQGSDSTAMYIQAMRFKSTFTVAQTAVSQSQTHPYMRLLTCGRRYEATRETEWCCSNVAAGSRIDSIANRPYIFTWTEERRGREEEVLQVVLKLCVGWLRMCVCEGKHEHDMSFCQRIWLQAVSLTMEYGSCFLTTVLMHGFAVVVWVSVADSCWLVMEAKARLLVWEAGSASSLLPCFFACRCSPPFSCPRIVSRNTTTSAMAVGSHALVSVMSV